MKDKRKRKQAMIIANPIYDVVFKYLMEDLEIAKGIISRILQEEVETLQFDAQERVLPKDYSVISLYRLDFVAQIRTADGNHKKILIEVQKAKLSSDISRFRNYLGKQYMRKDHVTDQDGTTRKDSLPIVTIYFLGLKLSDTLPVTVKVKREYLDALTGEKLVERSDFIESLTHDSYVIQIPKLHASMQSELERVLSVFAQDHFIDEKGHQIEYGQDPEKDELLLRIIRRLHHSLAEEDVRERMDLEDELYEETQAAINESTATLTQKLKITSGELEEAQKREQEAQKREQEERRQREEAQMREQEERRQREEERRQKESVIQTAIDALVAAGMSLEEARKKLGLD